MAEDQLRPRTRGIRADLVPPCPSVLVVDDNKVMRKLINGLLKGLFLDIVEATDGRHALELIESRHFDLILLDILMPEVDGLEVARRVRANPETADLPIVFCTSVRDPQAMSDATQLDNVDYLVKPLNSQMLLEKIDNFLSGWLANEEEVSEEVSEDVSA